MMMIFGLITVGKGIDLGIVEQTARTVSPRETLVALTQIIVLDELGTWDVVGFLVAKVGVDQAQTDGWHCDEEGQSLPDLVATGWKRGKSKRTFNNK